MQNALSAMLDDLSPELHRIWQADPANRALFGASASLTLAGISLVFPPIRIGKYAVLRRPPYWKQRALMDEQDVPHLKSVLDNDSRSRLERAQDLDAQIRKQTQPDTANTCANRRT